MFHWEMARDITLTQPLILKHLYVFQAETMHGLMILWAFCVCPCSSQQPCCDLPQAPCVRCLILTAAPQSLLKAQLQAHLWQPRAAISSLLTFQGFLTLCPAHSSSRRERWEFCWVQVSSSANHCSSDSSCQVGTGHWLHQMKLFPSQDLVASG